MGGPWDPWCELWSVLLRETPGTQPHRNAAVRAWAFAACILLAVRAAAQEPTPIPVGNKAPVVLDGRVLFEVGESGTWSPQQRAKEINLILRAAVAAPESVNLVLAEHDGFPTVRMGDWHLLTVNDSDTLVGMDPGEQAQRWLQVVEGALVQARVERSAPYLVSAWLHVLAALAFAALLHWLLGRLSRRLPIRLMRDNATAAAQAAEKPAWQLAIALICVALQAATWIAAAAYAIDWFPATRQLRYDTARLVIGGLGAPLFSVAERSYSAFDVLWLIGAFALLWMAVSLFTYLLSSRVMRATGATHGALQPVTTLLKYGLIAIGLIVILQAAGLNLSSLAIFASVIGVGIGFGLQNLANNFVSGIVLSFERPVKPGDFVSVGNLQGTVHNVGGRSTIIRTPDRLSIIVPNSRLLETDVINWSHGDELARLHLPVGVAYGSHIDTVRAALFEAARAHAAVLREPRPDVRMLGFGDNSINFELLVWSNDPPGHQQLQSDLYYRIEANLRGAGIEIPFPQRTLHVAPETIRAVLDEVRGTTRTQPLPRAVGSNGAGASEPIAPFPPNHTQFVAGASSPQTLDIDALVAQLRGPNGLTIEDRRHVFSVYRKCFVGSEAVAWLMRAHDLTREEALHLGQSLVQRRVFHHVLDEHPFRDGNFFYRFYADEQP